MGKYADEIIIEVETVRAASPQVRANPSEELLGGELWFDGTTGSPGVWFGVQ